MSKKVGLWLILVILISLSACHKGDEQLHEVKLQSNLFIPVGLNTIETHFFIIKDNLTFYQENLDLLGIQNSQVSRITGSRGEIYAKLSNLPLSFIRSVSIYAVSRTNPDLKKEMFYLDDVKINQGSSIQLLTAVSDMKGILDDTRFNLEVRLQFRNVPTSNQNLNIDFGYYIYE